MDHPDFIVCSFMEKSIGLKRVLTQSVFWEPVYENGSCYICQGGQASFMQDWASLLFRDSSLEVHGGSNHNI